MTQVVPAILPESFAHLREELEKVNGLVKRVQVDIANDTYAPSETWPFVGPDTDMFKKIVAQEEGFPLWDKLNFEVDMLVGDPEDYVQDWIKAGASALIIHIDSTTQDQDIYSHCKERNVEVGYGVSPGTETQDLFDIIEDIGTPDFIQCMGNDNIGFHGVELDSSVYKKIKEIHKEYQDIPISVDIGVNRETAPKLVQAGASRLVSGSAIFKAEDIKKEIKWFEKL